MNINSANGNSRILFVISLIGAAIFVQFLIASQKILVPLVLAVFLAYLILALEEKIQSHLPKRFITSRLVPLSGALFIVFSFVWIMALLIADNIGQVAEAAPSYEENFRSLLQNLETNFNIAPGLTPEKLVIWFNENINLQQGITSLATGIRSIASNAFLIILYTGFIILESGTFSDKIMLIAQNEDKQERITKAINDITARMRQYIVLKTFVSLMVGTASWGIMKLIGIDFAGFWAVLIFLLNFIPYIGSFIAVAFPVALTIVQFGSLPLFILSLTTLMAAQITVGNIIEPRLMGNSLNLSPLVILIAMITWGSIWGIIGAFLSVPLTVITMICLAQFESTKPIAILLSRRGRI